MDKPLKLAFKLAQIMGEITHVEKNGENTFHHYKYAMEADMLAAVRQKLAAAKIFVLTGVSKVEIRETPKDGFLTTIQTTHIFVDGETGETLEASSAGQGTDKGDKGVFKAITGATKYFISKNFLIPTGDDPEGFDEKRESAGRKPKDAISARPAAKAGTIAPTRTVAQAAADPNLPPNPWRGKIVNMTAPIKGVGVNGKPWERWDIETSEFNVSTFDSGVAEVCVNAISDLKTVEMVWKARADKSGQQWWTAEGMTIID